MRCWIVLILLWAAVSVSEAAPELTGEDGTTKSLVVSVKDLGPQFTSNTVHALGQDAAYSIPLAGDDQRALWVFGDTWTGYLQSSGAASDTDTAAHSRIKTIQHLMRLPPHHGFCGDSGTRIPSNKSRP